MDKLLPHYWSEVIMGVALVVIIWIVIEKFVAPKFEAAYEKRRDQIEGAVERAAAAEQKAAAALQQYQAQLATARDEAARIREDAKAQGAQILAELREQASAESDRILASARAKIDAERAQVMQQLRGDVGGLATTLAGRILGESLDDEQRARRVVDRFISELEEAEPVPSGQV